MPGKQVVTSICLLLCAGSTQEERPTGGLENSDWQQSGFTLRMSSLAEMVVEVPGMGEEVPGPPSLHWFPLATEQLRLRALSDVLLYHPTQGQHPESDWFHLSLHTTALSSPFLTCPAVRQVEERVLWPDLATQEEESLGGARGCVVRVWRRAASGGPASCLAVWGVGLAGLVCIGDKLVRGTTAQLAPDSLVFRLHQYYFVCNDSLGARRLGLCRRLEVPHITVESGKNSYDRSGLAKLHSTLRSLSHSCQAASLLKAELAARGLDQATSVAEAAPQLTRSISSKILEVRVKQSATRKQEIAMVKRIEDITFRIDSLRLERDRLREEVAGRRKMLEREGGELEAGSCLLTQSYHSLARDREQLEQWLASFHKSRESNRRTAESLRIRRLQLISQLSEIFPLQEVSSPCPTICYVALPSSESLQGRDDTDLAVGLGWAAHLTLMVSCLLGPPLRYPTHSAGSRSSVEDLILDRIPDKDRQFPLFPKGNERVRFDYGVFLLNKNIAQLRWLCGEATADARPTLRNLAGLLSLCSLSPGTELPASPEWRLPEAPPSLAGPALTVEEEPGEVLGVEVEVLEEAGELCGSEEVEQECDTSEEVEEQGDTSEEVEEPSETVEVLDSFCDKVAALALSSEPGESPPASDSLQPEHQNGEVEEAVEAADLFRDIAQRTQALAAPSSFKSSRQRYYK